MKTPKPTQLYDVCRMRSVRGIASDLSPDYTVYHDATIAFGKPVKVASQLVHNASHTAPNALNGNMVTGGVFYMYVKHGLKPLDVLRERKAKRKKKYPQYLVDIAKAAGATI